MLSANRPANRLRKAAGTLAVAAMAALGCSKASPTVPTEHGVNITVNAKALTSAELGMVTVGSLIVTGDELQAQQFSVVPQIATGQLTFQYLPKTSTATTAMLSFEFEALDSSGEVYGTGKAGPVTLSANAVSVTITLTASTGTLLKGLGTTCTAASDCGSGFCTDGVCCQEACKLDVCASCALTTTKGLCAPHPANTDPEKECVGFSMGTGAGGSAGKGGAGGAGGAKSDAGASMDASSSDAEAINPPDGGLMATPDSCGGTCNGMKACAFASPGTTCGKPFCNTHKDLASLVCDGNGTCGISLSDCTSGYACDLTAKPGSCRMTCTANTDCLVGYYCNGNNEMCQATKSDGLTCATDTECNSGHCATGVCCNTACDAPNSCNKQGSAGKCQCSSTMNCGTGVACQTFYQDADGDGYGNKNGTMAAGTAMPGCVGSPPAGFVADNTDCDDGDASVHPGQTGWFTAASKGVGTFDYDCDGTVVKEFPQYPGATCTFCPDACTAGCSAATSSTCASATAQASLACNSTGICLTRIVPPLSTSETAIAAETIVSPIKSNNGCCGCSDHGGYTQSAAVECGQSASYTTCGTCGSTSGTTIGSTGGTTTTAVAKVQACH
jgi:hypothetical protein